MCLYPRTLSNTIIPITVDCGYCPECINKRRDAWSFRLFHEQQSSFLTLFTFLSYDDNNLPLLEGHPVLNWTDITLYLKRVRKELSTIDVRLTYFIAGEYGPRTLRPHYHSIFQASICRFQEVSAASFWYAYCCSCSCLLYLKARR